MPNILDTFIVELDLDPNKISAHTREALDGLRKFKEEARTSSTQVETEFKRVDNVFASIKREMVAFGAGALGATSFGAFITNLTSMDAALGRNALTLNMNAKELAVWQSAAKQAGGTAEGITSTFQSVTQDIGRFNIGAGGGAILPMLNSLGVSWKNLNGQIKTGGQLLLDISEALDRRKVSGAMRASVLSTIPGMSQDALNLMMLGTERLRDYLAEGEKAVNVNNKNVEAAQQFNRELSLLGDSAMSLGRTLTSDVIGPLRFVLDLFKDAAQATAQLREQFKQGVNFKEAFNWLAGRDNVKAGGEWAMNGNPIGRFLFSDKDRAGFKAWLDETYGNDDKSAAEINKYIGTIPAFRGGGSAQSPGPQSAAPGAAPGYQHSRADIEAKIRAAAIQRNIDPNVAVEVYRREGVNNYVGDRGSSFGPFQLHYGGMAGGGMAVGGLGDKFTRRTGLDARDPTTIDQQIAFSLDEAQKNGWGAWHGWRGLAFAGIDSPGAAPAAAASVSNDNSRGGDTKHDVAINVYPPRGGSPMAYADAVGDKVREYYSTASQANGNR